MSTNPLRKIKTFLRIRKENKLDFKKSMNLVKVYSSLYSKNPIVNGMPFMMLIEPTNCCNLKCPVCPTGANKSKRVKGFIEFEVYTKLIDEVGDYLIGLYLTNYGEPLMHAKISDMVKYAHDKGIKTGLTTNGHFFNNNNVYDLINSGLDDICISLDGINQETLGKYRVGADFNKVVKGIKTLVGAKKELNSKKPIISLQFVVMKHNEAQISEIRKFAKELGVDKLALKTVWVTNEQEAADLLPSDPKFIRYNIENGEIKWKIDIKNKCSKLWTESVVNWDGKVVPCCYDMYDQHVFGNIKENSFKEIWNNSNYVNFRKMVLKDKGMIPICKNCPGAIDLAYEEEVK